MPTTSPNMGLTVPVPSTGVTGTGDPGPGYATNISNDFTNVLDAHDHSSGKGVQITPAGMNVNADLSFASNNATNLRAARFTSQASGLVGASDSSELYVKTGDLWYVSSSGVQVQITSGSSLATGVTGGVGATGTIGASGAAGAPGPAFTGTFNVPTATWQPTGGFSGTYKVTSWVSAISLSSGMFTGVPAAYVITPTRGTVIGVVANIVGYDGYANAAEVDLKGTYLGSSGTVATPGVATGVGTFTNCYQQNSPQASGWGFVLQPTGSQISLMISVPTLGWSGTTNFTATLQVTERGTP